PEPCWPRRASHWTEPLDCAVGRSEAPGAVGEAVVSSMARPPERAVPARPVRACPAGPPGPRRGAQALPDRSARPNRRTSRENSLAEFISTMYKARTAVGEKLILDGVTRSFYPGAKIGMVGPNGAGKSTIRKIMAGLYQPS